MLHEIHAHEDDSILHKFCLAVAGLTQEVFEEFKDDHEQLMKVVHEAVKKGPLSDELRIRLQADNRIITYQGIMTAIKAWHEMHGFTKAGGSLEEYVAVMQQVYGDPDLEV